jgi:hypothetical protein
LTTYQHNLIEDGLKAAEDILDWMSGRRIHPVTRPEVQKRVGTARDVLRQVLCDEGMEAGAAMAGGA